MEGYQKCFENYEVNRDGAVRRKLKTGAYKPVNGSVLKIGYQYVQLNRNGKRLNLMIHEQVAKAFIGPRPAGMVTDHIDRNKLNNNVANLRYVTYAENARNSDKYRADIAEQDPKKRASILAAERYRRKGLCKGIRKRGTGHIYQTAAGKWVNAIKKNGIITRETFDTEEAARTCRED